MGRIYAIPDIHGRLDLLAELLARLETDEKIDLAGEDKLIFLGDMVDRGPDSAAVLKIVRSVRDQFPKNVTALYGNHEDLMVKAIENPDRHTELWYMNGGRATVKSYPYGIARRLMLDDVAWLKTLPLFHEEPGFFFSHAPIPKEDYRRIENQGQPYTQEEYIWTYDASESGVAKVHDNGVIGVCGHIHALRNGVTSPRFYPHYIMADAGCGCSVIAPLVAVEVRSRKVLTVWPEEVTNFVTTQSAEK